jgi:tetratricopeptide (TPR) repeat protein
VLFINAIGDRGNNKIKDWGIYQSWPRLVAAHGLIGVSMEADGARIQESLRGVFDFLTSKGAEHGIDGSRLGLYAASANVTGATEYLASEGAAKGIRAAALYYGGVPATPLRTDLPVLFIVAQSDLQWLGPSLATLWQKVIETRAPWSLQFGKDLPHGFDGLAPDSEDARRVVQQTLAFWRSHLEPIPAPASLPPPAAREIVAASRGNNPQRAAELLTEWTRNNPTDTTALVLYGQKLTELRRFDEAAAAYEKALALGATEPGIFVGLGQIRMGQKQYEQATMLMTRAISAGARDSRVYGQLAWAQLHLGRNEEAIKSYEKAFEIGIPPGANTRGVAYFNMACGYARIKQNQKALEVLEKAIAEGFTNRNAFETDEDLAPLRAEPKFQELLARLPK